ncbi:hypothetical protein BpHYR1_002294 [Brachionus plicatilis]|uniref:Uncharacterized protein n=1 Tax=Brachionus plicatilis TaxID=10195 RepID=A0A3M7QAX7_BRAPC|nr:hypothetical protein BpHYR1_002294 [Brachionus plicatilis]
MLTDLGSLICLKNVGNMSKVPSAYQSHSSGILISAIEVALNFLNENFFVLALRIIWRIASGLLTEHKACLIADLLNAIQNKLVEKDVCLFLKFGRVAFPEP